MNEKHYRYCFACDKWLTKQGVNEVDWGEQPGEKDGKGWYCKYCRNNLGDQIQIFKCDKHDIILKVWGTCEGQNKKKIFYQECPQCQQQERQPDKETIIGKRAFWFIGGAIVVIGGLAWLIYHFFFKKEE